MGHLLKVFAAAALVAVSAVSAHGHDTWVQTNAPVVRTGDAVHVDLMLGNHGNDHRDFKIAGKAGLDGTTLAVINPDGETRDLRPGLADLGYTENEGHWSVPVIAPQPGLYTLAHTSEKIVTYAPKRSVKSAKAFFVASDSLDKVSMDNAGFGRVLGHALELVPLTNPVTPMGPGVIQHVKLLYNGKPLANHRVSFIPRGATLSGSFDDRYERMTDANGVAKFEFKQGNYYLIVAHHEDPRKGEGYDSTKYSATMTVLVPALCPCCAE